MGSCLSALDLLDIHRDLSYKDINARLRVHLKKTRPLVTRKSKLLSNFYQYDKLGSGSFGKVCKVRKEIFKDEDEFDVISISEIGEYNLETEFALKFIERFSYSTVSNEVESLSSLIHPNIVNCYNVWEEKEEECGTEEWGIIEKIMANLSDNDSSCTFSCGGSISSNGAMGHILCLQFELCDGGTLEDYLDEKLGNSMGESGVAESSFIFTQILEGLKYLEIKGVVHGDLKPNNIFIKRNENGRIKVKIGDFGLSFRLNANNENCESNRRERRIYQPPELLESTQPLTHKSDMYAFGLIYLQIITSHSFKTAAKRRMAVYNAMEGRFPPIMEKSNKLSLIQLMTHPNKEQRPSANLLSDSLNHNAMANPSYALDFSQENKIVTLKLAEIATALKSDKAFFKKGYRYLLTFFDLYLMTHHQFSAHKNYSLEKIVTWLYEESLALSREADYYYRLKTFIPILQNNVDTLEATVLEFKSQYLVLLSNNYEKAPSQQFMEHFETQLNRKQMLNQVLSSPAYRMLKNTEDIVFIVQQEVVKQALAKNLNYYGNYSQYLDEYQEIMNANYITLNMIIEHTALCKYSVKRRKKAELQRNLFKLYSLKYNLALIFEKVGEINEAREHFHLLLKLVKKQFKNLKRCKISPNILSKYAFFIASNVVTFPSGYLSALIYLMAAYQLMEEIVGYLFSDSYITSGLMFVFTVLDFKTDLENFLGKVHYNREKERTFLLTLMKGDNLLSSNLFDGSKLLQNTQNPWDNLIRYKNPTGPLYRYKSVGELLKRPPHYFLIEGEWTQEILRWARKLYAKI